MSGLLQEHQLQAHLPAQLPAPLSKQFLLIQWDDFLILSTLEFGESQGHV